MELITLIENDKHTIQKIKFERPTFILGDYYIKEYDDDLGFKDHVKHPDYKLEILKEYKLKK